MIICLCVWVSTFFLCFLKTAAAQKILSGFRVLWFLLVSHGKQAAKIAGENIVCNVAEEWNPGSRRWFEATCWGNSHEEEVQGNCVLPNNSVASCSLEEEDGENHHHTIRGNISTKTGVEYWSLWGYFSKAFKHQHLLVSAMLSCESLSSWSLFSLSYSSLSHLIFPVQSSVSPFSVALALTSLATANAVCQGLFNTFKKCF